MKKDSHTGQYASRKRMENLERAVGSMQASISSQNEVIADLRAKLLPVPVDLLGPRQNSPAVRNAAGVLDG